MSLSRLDFLSHADDIPTEEVPVPEWGEGATVRVRCLSIKQRLAWGEAVDNAEQGIAGPDPISILVVSGAVDDDGKPLFQLQDVDAIVEFRGDIIDRIANKVLDLSGSSEGSLPSAEGKSETAPSLTSPSTSPNDSDAPSPS